ncbi:hypothetical protein EhV18_00445 [Emiliania huxleyi virus 18]|nr:hypothetical protein EhV18_00445 [Emiliania huxleyi virus 18]
MSYRETSVMHELGGIFSDLSKKYNRQFEVTWIIADSKGHAIKSQTHQNILDILSQKSTRIMVI